MHQARIQGKAYRAYAPPPLKFSKIRVLGIYIHVKNDKYARISVSSYVTIINLPLISDFISYYADSEAAR